MKLVKVGLLFVLAVSLMGSRCSQEGEDNNPPFIKSWNISSQNDQFAMSAVFGDNYEVDMEAEILFKNYGSAYLYSNTQKNFVVDLHLNIHSFFDIDLNQQTTLPTGARFPSLVERPMGMISLTDANSEHNVNLYFDSAPFGNVTRLVGVGIQVDGIDHNFPTVSVTQNYFLDGKKFAAFQIYGPKLSEQGEVLVPGGLFLVGDINTLVNQMDDKIVVKQTEVEGIEGLSQQEIQSLMIKARRVLENTGIIRFK